MDILISLKNFKYWSIKISNSSYSNHNEQSISILKGNLQRMYK